MECISKSRACAINGGQKRAFKTSTFDLFQILPCGLAVAAQERYQSVAFFDAAFFRLRVVVLESGDALERRLQLEAHACRKLYAPRRARLEKFLYVKFYIF